jgi:4-hydroxyphenylacetate 3-hydroxylase, reductase component
MTTFTAHLNSRKSPELDERALRKAFGKFTTGVTVITANSGGTLVGMTANSFSSVSLNPPLVLWSLRKSSTSFDAFMSATHFAINVMSTTQIPLSQHFARSSDKKFADIAFRKGLGGSPIFDDTTAIFECGVESKTEAGDHVIIIGRVLNFEHDEVPPLVFSEGRYQAAIEHPSTRLSASQSQIEDADDPLHQFFSVLLLRAFHRMVDHAADVRAAEGITANESRMLNIATAYPGKALEMLRPVTRLSDSAVDDTLQSLSEKGLLTVGTDDTVVVTEAGQNCSERIKSHIATIEEHVLRGVPDKQVQEFRRLLAKIIQSHPYDFAPAT